nr:hypothetical protein [Ruminococcus sp.]
MKKVLALVLTFILLLSLTSCGGGEESKSNAIELTMDNYSKYLDITGGISCNEDSDNELYVGSLNRGYGIETPSGSTLYVYDTINYHASVEGLSQNFNYNDIKVTVKLTGSCKTFKLGAPSKSFYGSQSFENDIEIECDITGNGSFNKDEKLSDGAYTASEVLKSNFEIVSISGTVT